MRPVGNHSRSETMNQARPRGVQHLVLAVLPTALVVLAFLLSLGSSLLAPRGAFPAPWQLLGWVLLGAVAALHRPFEGRPGAHQAALPGTLGLGALVLGPILATQGVTPAALAAGSTLALAELLRHFLYRVAGISELDSPRILASLERAVLALGVTLAVGWLMMGWLMPGWPIGGRPTGGQLSTLSPDGVDLWLTILPALAFGLLFGLAVAALDAMRNQGRPSLRLFAPLLLDTLGFAAGTLLALLAESTSWPVVLPHLLLIVVLAAEAARLALLRVRSESRVGNLERMQEAHERILGETAGMGSIAQQILVECRNVLPVQWFQFESPTLEGRWQSWAAGPDGLMVEGRPRPPARPNMLPGIHRRAEWDVFEQALRVSGEPEEGEELAVIRLWCDPRRIEPGAERLFATLLPHMASSVHRARLDREAKLDPLTGVPVRRLLDSRLQSVFRRSCEEGKPMAVIMCDIDFFKKVNDTWGHAAGDEALKLVAKTLDTQRRESDLCCRYGGEEFTVLLENTDGEDAVRLAERLRQAIAALAFTFGENKIPLTLSLGVASFPELHIKTASELLLLADEALYEAKKRGRNQALLNIGRSAFRAPVTGDASDIIEKPW